jgi:hypothetical protein
MSISLQIGSFSLQSSTVITSTLSHEGTPTQKLDTLKISRRDGEKLISTTFNPKTITIAGTIKGTSLANLETNIDTFKKNVNVTAGNLDIEYAGTVRRYLVALESVAIERSHYHITFSPFSVIFRVLDPPFGLNVTGLGGTLSYNEALSALAITTQAYSSTVSFDGTAPPKPQITYVLDTLGNLDSIQETVVSKKAVLTMNTAFNSGDQLLIDTENQRVYLNGKSISYAGIFPEYDLGDNTVKTTLAATSPIDQQQTLIQDDVTVFQGRKWAQGFQVDNTGTISKVRVFMYNKTIFGASGTININIQTNSGGNPSGTQVANSSVSVNVSSIPNDGGWVDFAFSTAPTLTTGVQYHLVIDGASLVNPGTAIRLGVSEQNVYNNGTLKQLVASWSDRGVDLAFEVHKNATPSWSVDKKIEYVKRYL